MLVGSGRRRGARVLGQVGLVVGVAGLLTDLCVGVTFWKAKPGRIAYLPSKSRARQAAPQGGIVASCNTWGRGQALARAPKLAVWCVGCPLSNHVRLGLRSAHQK